MIRVPLCKRHLFGSSVAAALGQPFSYPEYNIILDTEYQLRTSRRDGQDINQDNERILKRRRLDAAATVFDASLGGPPTSPGHTALHVALNGTPLRTPAA